LRSCPGVAPRAANLRHGAGRNLGTDEQLGPMGSDADLAALDDELDVLVAAADGDGDGGAGDAADLGDRAVDADRGDGGAVDGDDVVAGDDAGGLGAAAGDDLVDAEGVAVGAEPDADADELGHGLLAVGDLGD